MDTCKILIMGLCIGAISSIIAFAILFIVGETMEHFVQ